MIAVSGAWIAAGVALVALALASRRGERPSSRISSGAEPPRAPPTPDIDTLIRAGRTIEAIKAYRRAHGTDLKDAKDAIDARARELGRPG